MSIDFSTVTSVTIPEGDVVQIAIGGSTVWKRQPPAGYWEVTRSDGTAPAAGTMWVVRLSDGSTGYYDFTASAFTAVSFAVGDVVGHDDIMFSVDVSIASGHMSQYVSLNGGTYKCVNWGDGTVTAVASGAFAVSHTYATAGTYTVKTYAVNPTSIAYYSGMYTDNRVSAINSVLPWGTLTTVSTFMANAKITEIPENLKGLFDKCTNTTSFTYIFLYCSSLGSIPEGLFDHCQNIKYVLQAFYRTGLTSIPDNLFTTANNPALENFKQCFYYCTSVTGSLPELWSSYPSSEYTQCFTGCTQATNYADAQQAGWA